MDKTVKCDCGSDAVSTGKYSFINHLGNTGWKTTYVCHNCGRYQERTELDTEHNGGAQQDSSHVYINKLNEFVKK